MKEFKDKVAVVTGAASGIGQALALQCAKEGMKVAIADVNEKGLRWTERKINRQGITVLSVPTDVSKANDIELLAQKTIDSFGEVHLLFNNAGIALPRLTWEYELKDWELVLGVNLWGAIHCIRTFVPIMIKQDTECHIINTSSLEGILSTGLGGATYGVTKHALVFLSERLAIELKEHSPKIKVSLLCPGLVNTNIFVTMIKLLSEYMDDFSEIDENIVKKRKELLNQFFEGSPPINPEEVATIVFKAIRDEKFYIFTHTQPIMRKKVEDRFNAILKAFN
ncbi:MAG: SDR family NAD(P)-dependent oxidoreductase [Candidatus Hermodarchaeota archaeon]